MRVLRAVVAVALCCASAPSFALEGSAAAGPIGGTDIRSSLPLLPGLYGGTIAVYAEASKFYDGAGHLIPALSELALTKTRAGAFLIYVPDLKVLGGTVSAAGFIPAGPECGHLFGSTPKRCVNGPYVEFGWSRYFGTTRASRYPGTYPIPEGLAVSLAFGVVVPMGRYNASDATLQGISVGNNIWDFAPIIGFTYTSPPILAEGTEITGRLFWNNYLTNPATQYATGSLLNLDFAVTEHIGRWQGGLAGLYITQIADDTQFGVRVPPDGHRAEVFELGPVLAYDLPESGAAVKIKALKSLYSINAVSAWGVAVGWIKKFK